VEWLFLTLALVVACLWLGRRLDAAAKRAPHRAAEPAATLADAGADPAQEIGDELDLHGVAPREVPVLVDEFLAVARSRGTRCVTIVHGRGTGILRRRVRELLERRDDVVRYDDAMGRAGGATAVWLAPLAPRRDGD
jgi:DNA-nicking Smr family endonuclease